MHLRQRQCLRQHCVNSGRGELIGTDSLRLRLRLLHHRLNAKLDANADAEIGFASPFTQCIYVYVTINTMLKLMLMLTFTLTQTP